MDATASDQLGQRSAEPPAVAGRSTGALPRDEPVGYLLRRWLGLSELNHRALLALVHEIDAGSALMERGVLDLVAHSEALVAAAGLQMQRAERLITMAQSVRVAEQTRALENVTGQLQQLADWLLSQSPSHLDAKQTLRYLLNRIAGDVHSAAAQLANIAAVGGRLRGLMPMRRARPNATTCYKRSRCSPAARSGGAQLSATLPAAVIQHCRDLLPPIMKPRPLPRPSWTISCAG